MCMQDLALFLAADRAFTVRQVLSAADFRGELAPVRQAAREGLACQRYGEDEAFETDLEDLNQAAEVYREDRDLTTAEDTEHWLAVHPHTVDDFSAWLERRAWRERFLPNLACQVS
jgi:hypothetical protein